jgi:phosphoribosylamine-glycine ligase
MNYNLKDKTVIVFDYGLFLDVAIRLSRDFRKVYYFMPYEKSFTIFNNYVIGSGIENVERIDKFFDYVDEADLIYFTDVNDSDLQEYLRRKGKLVYGAGKAVELEVYREKLKEMMKDVKLPMPKYQMIKGLDNLTEFLEDKENLFIKISLFRGNMETFHFKNMKLSRPFLNKLQHTMGFIKDSMEFMVEWPIEDAIEAGTDLICVNGEYSKTGIFGIETKGDAYVSKFTNMSEVPKPVIDVNDKIAPKLKEYGYKGSLSTEVRIQRNVGYFIDITARQPNPPTSCLIDAVDNFSEAVYGAALGEVVELTSKYKYAVQLQIQSSWAEQEPLPIYFPKKYKDRVHIKNLCVSKSKDGEDIYNFMPSDEEMSTVASVVGLGNTMRDAIDECKKVALSLEAYSLDFDLQTLDQAADNFSKLIKMYK